ncbi:MAG: hypothetical protein JKX83_06900 [Pseudomonadales bacterium]|nr:hypothetical protein [Pseudomonadales bacterium]
MNRYLKIGLLLAASISLPSAVNGSQWSAEVGYESRIYQHSGPQGQAKIHPSLRFEGEYYKGWKDGLESFTFSPILVVDVQDGERSHFDIREFSWVHVDDGWELRGGIRTVFWGVMETRHLVDIINQTDQVMNLDGEDKLGQPMINLSIDQSWGTLDFYLMSFFRDRTFIGPDGRLRGPLVVDVDNPKFESSNKRSRIEGAVRWHQYFGDFDIALSHFSGIGRAPTFELAGSVVGVTFVPNGLVTPVYAVVDQTGIEMQYMYEGWAFKLEAISHYGHAGRYSATAFGFEFTQSGLYDTRLDLGWVVEYSYDGRDESAPVGVPEHDLTVATRWALNDVDASEALLGVVVDSQSDELVFFLEASKRLGEYWKVYIESRIFVGGKPLPHDLVSVLAELSSPDSQNKLGYLQDEDFLRIEFVRYF